MVHRTRKRLTKTELKRDPIAENLVKAWDFVRDHIKEVAIGAAVVLVVIVAVQALGNTSRNQNARAMARYMMADLMYEQCEQMALSGQAQQLQESVAFFVLGSAQRGGSPQESDGERRVERRSPNSPMRGNARPAPAGAQARAANGTNFKAY